MRRLLLVGLCVIAIVFVFGFSATADAQSQDGISPQFGGGCGCPKTARFCCTDCNGQFAYCAPSPAYCPECPAP